MRSRIPCSRAFSPERIGFQAVFPRIRRSSRNVAIVATATTTSTFRRFGFSPWPSAAKHGPADASATASTTSDPTIRRMAPSEVGTGDEAAAERRTPPRAPTFRTLLALLREHAEHEGEEREALDQSRRDDHAGEDPAAGLGLAGDRLDRAAPDHADAAGGAQHDEADA